MRTLRLLLLVIAACGDSPSQPDHGVDLDRLFAAPTAAEIAAVEADWSARATAARDVRVELERDVFIGITPMHARIVSHVVDGYRHYGAVLAPPTVSAQLPILLYLHGGDGGVAVDEIALVSLMAGIAPQSAVWVIPSFRAEPLMFASQTWLSEGEPSPWDRDVDDTLGLIAAAAQLHPAADGNCIGAIGLSRGAGVGLLLSARDPRMRATVAFFGPTDFFGSFVRQVTEEALRGQMRPLPGLTYLNERWLQPLRRGQASYADVRLALLARSAAWFVHHMGPVQLHHGTADDIVPVSQAHAFIAAMNRIGRTAPDFEGYIYQGGAHNPLTMPGSAERAGQFIRSLPDRCD